jgi:hypothetical protein
MIDNLSDGSEQAIAPKGRAVMENRFDELAKAFAEGVSRREALRRFVGGLVGALLASLGLELRAFGAPGGPSPGASHCVNFCLSCGLTPPGRAFGDCVAGCEACRELNGSLCACPAAGSAEPICCLPGTHCCNRACFDLLSNNANCGACGHVCPFGTICCGGACVNPLTDGANCGGCLQACPSGTICIGGHCCGYNTIGCNDTCVDPLTDVDNCGGCGIACAAGQTCQLGQCTCTTSAHCPGGQDCSNGLCVQSCPGSQTDCGGFCVDTSRDAHNCGGCGVVCGSATPFCVSSVCVQCLSPADCPVPANGMATCSSSGTCGIACNSGFSACSGACVDTQADANNCGACGTACPSGTCVCGHCRCSGATAACPPGQLCDRTTICNGTGYLICG